MHRPITPQRAVNGREAADAFVHGHGSRVRSVSSSLTITDRAAYSYGVPIACFDPVRQGTLHITRDTYSTTTSKHTGMIRRACEAHNVPTIDSDEPTLRRMLA